MKNLPQVKR